MSSGLTAWYAAMLGVAIYCGVQAVRDLRSRAYGMAVLGVHCIGVVLLLPTPTGPISGTLPAQR